MSVEMKLGRWRNGRGRIKVIDHCSDIDDDPQYYDSRETNVWDMHGECLTSLNTLDNLIEYLGPLELSPTPACADQAGTPVVSHVSTETAGEQLRRVNARLSAVRSELDAYRRMVKGLEWVEGDLEELAKRLEREVEG